MTKPKGSHGGRRAGAGRPPGPPALGYGESKAVKTLRWRVPEGTPRPVAEIADEGFATIVKVMRGEVFDPQDAAVRLKAATRARDEVCGPVAQKLEHDVAEGVSININRTVKK